MTLGKIASVHRYPVKSMKGETIDEAYVGKNGIPGDRAWAVRDEVRGGIRGAKKIPGLMEFSAHYESPPGAEGSSIATITFSDGARMRTGDQSINARLSSELDHEVSLWPLMPEDQLDHYRRGAPDTEDFEKELREIFGRTEEEPLPDLSVFPPELLEYESPPGTYFDAFPLLILSRKSIETMGERQPGSRFDLRRFRPNFLVEDTLELEDFPEETWEGSRLQIGSAVLKAELVCPRCVVTTQSFDDLPRDPAVMRALVRENGGNLGLYASVEQPGKISVGDSINRLE